MSTEEKLLRSMLAANLSQIAMLRIVLYRL